MSLEKSLGLSGVLYAACGERHLDEAIRSAQSVRKAMPGIPIAIYTDSPARVPVLFDHVIKAENAKYHYEDKIVAMCLLPFEKTLFLDTDTFMILDCRELFDLLEYCSLAAAHDPLRVGAILENCSPAYPELNTGVILFKKESSVQRFLENWLSRHRELDKMSPGMGDQTSFREKLYTSGLKTFCLPSEYNFRTVCTNYAGANADIKIIHGRHEDVQKVSGLLNSCCDFRAFFPSLLHYFNPENACILNKNGRFVQKLILSVLKFFRRIHEKIKSAKKD